MQQITCPNCKKEISIDANQMNSGQYVECPNCKAEIKKEGDQFQIKQ